MDKLDNTVSTKVADSTLSRIDEHAERHGMSKSEAVRDRLRVGLDATAVPGAHVSYGGILTILGFIFIAAQYAEASGLIGPAGVAAVVAGLGYDLGHRLGFL